MGLVPEKLPARIVLTPDSTPTTIDVLNAWQKPVDVSFTHYAGVQLQGKETLLKIPDIELNPSSNGYVIRPKDQIIMDGITYVVRAARLMSVRTVWECVCREAGI